MKDSDLVRLEDVATVRAATAQTSRKVLLVAALAGPVGGIIMLLATRLLFGQSRLVAGYALAAVFASFSIPLFLRWRRHYLGIATKLDDLESRVKNGEQIYGSQVKFNSHR